MRSPGAGSPERGYGCRRIWHIPRANADKPPNAVPASGGLKGRGVQKRSLTGRRRAPGAPAPQEDDPGRCQAQLDPLGAVPAFLPARVVADFGVEPDTGAFRLEHPFVGRVVLGVVQRRAASTAVDGVARAERLHRRRARAEGAGDPLVAAVLIDPTADIVYELPERDPLIYSHACPTARYFWLKTRGRHAVGPPLAHASRLQHSRAAPRCRTIYPSSRECLHNK